jgi:hypothetical protein
MSTSSNSMLPSNQRSCLSNPSSCTSLLLQPLAASSVLAAAAAAVVAAGCASWGLTLIVELAVVGGG